MANNIASINLDGLRTKSIAELNEIAREYFGIELKGTKPERLKVLNELVRKAQNEALAMEISDSDITLDIIRDEIVGKAMPVSRLVININTGMIFFNTPTLANNPNMRPYYKVPVLVNGRCVMDPDYARALIPDCEITHAPKEYRDAVPKIPAEVPVNGNDAS